MKMLDEITSYNLLSKFGLNVPEFELLDKPETKLTLPVVLKVCSSNIVHKSDVGGVILNIHDTDKLKNAWHTLKERFKDEKIVAIKMVEKTFSTVETIVGITHDKTFGSVIMFGMGGILAELYKDTTFRIIPITKEDGFSMIDDLKSKKLFYGFRGIHIDRDMVSNMLFNISNIVQEAGVVQMDLNPIYLEGKSHIILDAKVWMN